MARAGTVGITRQPDGALPLGPAGVLLEQGKREPGFRAERAHPDDRVRQVAKHEPTSSPISYSMKLMNDDKSIPSEQMKVLEGCQPKTKASVGNSSGHKGSAVKQAAHTTTLLT